MSASSPLLAAYKGPAADVLMFAKLWSQASGRPLRVVTIYPGAAPISMGARILRRGAEGSEWPPPRGAGMEHAAAGRAGRRRLGRSATARRGCSGLRLARLWPGTSSTPGRRLLATAPACAPTGDCRSAEVRWATASHWFAVTIPARHRQDRIAVYITEPTPP